MEQVILVLHVVVAVVLIGLVLLQQGKGSAMGAGFGSGGASTSMFGSQGATPFLVKLTAGLAAVFFITSLTLSYVAGQGKRVDAVKEIATTATHIQVLPHNASHKTRKHKG